MAGLGKLLGYSYNDEVLSKALQTLSASDSMDFRALLQPDGSLSNSITNEDSLFYDSGYANGSSSSSGGI